MTCEETPVLVDCDFAELPVTTDPLGNPVIQFCPPDENTFPPVHLWNSDTDDSPQPGEDGEYLPGFYFDVAAQCTTHYSWSDTLYPFGCDDPEPVMTEVCYDLAPLGAGPYCFGGGTTGWEVGGANRYTPDCYDPTATGTTEITVASAAQVLVNPDYSASNGKPPPQGTLPALYASATDTGQTSPVTVSGEPNVQPYFGAIRPTVFIDHTATDTDCVGPLCFRFVNTITSGAIGVAMWHRPTDTFADITLATGPESSTPTYGDDGYGDYAIWNTTGSTGGQHQICYANTEGTPASEYTIVVFALGGNQPNPIEQLDNLAIEYTRRTMGTPCCECHTAAALATVLTANDPNEDAEPWTASGSTVCAMVPVGDAATYGPLSFCEGTVVPVGDTDPPVFVSAPASQICVDELTEECAECVGGVTTLQEFVNGAWIDV